MNGKHFVSVYFHLATYKKRPLSILRLFTHFLYEKFYKIFSYCLNNTPCIWHLVGYKKWLVIDPTTSPARQHHRKLPDLAARCFWQLPA
jgi:hypothetical protein